MNWTKEEDDILKAEYKKPIKDRDYKKLKRSNKSIWHRAQKLGIAKKNNVIHNIAYPNKLKILFNNSRVSNYWLGFILADGNISSNNELRITLSQIDRKHLNKLAKYLSINLKEYSGKICFNQYQQNDYVSISCRDVVNAPIFNQLFNINLNLTKTKSFPTIPYTNKDFLIPLLAGLLDGDGTVDSNKGKFTGIKIQCYHTWFDFYSKLAELLQDVIPFKCKIDTQGYCRFSCHRTQFLKDFKQQILDLPILERKWDLIK